MSFQELKKELAACHSREALRRVVTPYLDQTFSGINRGLFFFDEMKLSPEERARFLDNPVASSFLKTEASLYESLVVDNETWRRYCPRADHGHVLVGPLVCGGTMIGMIAVTRSETKDGFDEVTLAAMNRLCLFVSSRLSDIGQSGQHLAQQLTPREKAVAELAAQGLSNAKIAQELVISEHTVKQHLKAVFRKLEVSSRSELGWILRSVAR